MRRHLRFAIPIALLALVFLGLYSQEKAARREVEREQARCRSASLPLTQSEWPSAHVSASNDAAPDYEAMAAQLDANDFSEAEYDLLDRMSGTKPVTAEEISRVRHAFEKRRLVMDTLFRTVEMPGYAYGADLSPAGLERDILGPARLRTAAKLMRDYAMLLAREGRYGEAAHTLALGYRIGSHTYSIPTIMGYLTGDAVDHIVSVGFQRLLQVAGPDPVATRAVRNATGSAPAPGSLAYALAGSIATDEGWFTAVRAGGYGEFSSGFAYGDPGRYTDPSLWKPGLSTFALRFSPTTYRTMVYGAEAAYLRTVRDAVTFADRPYAESQAETARLKAALNPRRRSNAYARSTVSMLESSLDRRAYTLASRSVLLASTDVLEYRARTGRFPDRLEQAMPHPPEDPFTGKRLMYQRKQTNGFVIFSAGPEGRSAPPRREDMYQAAFYYPRTPLPSERP